MAVRALVIAIESYQRIQVGGMAKNLPGTLQAGLDFKAWLLAKWNAEGRKEAETQLIFCSDPPQAGGSAATSSDIRGALLKLRHDGRGATEELYFFFSGHGCSFVEQSHKPADILFSSDYENPDQSVSCCLKLDEIVSWLRGHLGPGRHCYFVDACRNSLDPSQIQVAPLLRWDSQISVEASTFVLQSTVDGATAAVGGPFAPALLAGLNGKGKAKVWRTRVRDAMFVRYDSLRIYLQDSLPNQRPTSHVEGKEGEGDVILTTIRPIPLAKCTIEISNASKPIE
jgi:hypothetical protein